MSPETSLCEEDEELLSDIPSIKRQHMTDGYREGLSVGKAQVMQRGFDEGYSIGVQIGLRVGPILGVLEAFLSCNSIDANPGMREKVEATYTDARHSLSIPELLKNYDEGDIMAVKEIPTPIEMVIEFWEGKVTAVYEAVKGKRRKAE